MAYNMTTNISISATPFVYLRMNFVWKYDYNHSKYKIIYKYLISVCK